MKHVIGAVIVVALLTVGGVLVLTPANLLPEQASVQAVVIDKLFSYEFVVIAFLFALIMGLMIYSVIFFRRKPGDLEDGPHIEGNANLELVWTTVPLVTVLVFAIIGSNTLANVLHPDPKALEVRVIGQQWAWSFEYPDYGVVSDKLVLPVNKQALLRITSKDVLHAFWVKEFRLKQDAVPGVYKDLRVTPTEIKRFTLMCAEICGRNHAYMLAEVRVVSQADFDQFIQDSQIPTDPVARGEYWYRTQGCKACHSIDGSKIVGPSYKGLFGSQVQLEDGTTVTADEAYIKESIINPNAKIVKGFAGANGKSAMPESYAKSLSDDQINDIIAWIKTLK